jgi:spermidine synthase
MAPRLFFITAIDEARKTHYDAQPMPEQTEQAMPQFVLPGLLACFFFSGTAGLVYQVAWSKSLGLIFGHTAYAVATVLAVFMGGLAAGSAWIGRWSESKARPLALYGWIELGVAATGAVSLAGLAGVRTAYVAAYPLAAGNSAVLLALRFIGAALVLFLPTFLMGGTLPVLVRGLSRGKGGLGQRLARLYWVNTAGAVAGTFAAGFLFLPVLGLRLTVAVAVGLNILAGGLALLLSRTEVETTAAPATESASARGVAPSRFLLACFAVVGASAMAYEIGWTRLLSTQLGSSTYSFTLMLATFLTGIVIGSAAFEWWTRRHEVHRTTFAVTQTLTALAALAFLVSFPRIPEVLPPILRATHQSFRGLVLAQFVTSALAMLPAAIVFGFNFPVVMLLLSPKSSDTSSSHAGDSTAVGRAYAWNTLGAIVGATSVGFWLLPLMGSYRLLAATAGANLLLAAALCISDSPRRFAALVVNVVLLCGLAAVVFSPYFYDRDMATFNTVLYWNLYDTPLTLKENAKTTDVIYAADGLNATISVARTDDYVALRTNGKVDASNEDATTQLLVGHIGGLSHPAPHRVLVIGFGSGMTVSALARYPELEHLDVVEIEPAVIGAAPLLTRLNRNVLQDPRVHVILDDGRNFLLTTRNQYDLIISEPSNPWIAGVATLFTREFYHAAQARLAPGGIFVQWVQAYSLFPDDLRMVLATLLTEFHGAALWHGDSPDLLLVAPSPPSAQILQRIQSLWSNPRLHDDFQQLGMEDPAGVFGFYLLDDAGLRRFAATGLLNTDDRTLLEYDAPRALLVPDLQDTNRKEIVRVQHHALPDDLTGDLRDRVAAAAIVTSVNQDDTDGADQFLHELDGRPETVETAIARGRLAIAHEQFGSAQKAFDAALTLDPHSIPAAWGRAEAERLFGSNAMARDELLSLLQKDPNNIRALDSLRKLDTDFSRWPEAVEIERRLMAAKPEVRADDYADLGELLMHAGDTQGGLSALQTALEKDPYNYQAHFNLGQYYDTQKNWVEARKHLELVKRFFPDDDAQTYKMLYAVDGALGDSRAGNEAAAFGMRMFPNDTELKKLKPLP